MPGTSCFLRIKLFELAALGDCGSRFFGGFCNNAQVGSFGGKFKERLKCRL